MVRGPSIPIRVLMMTPHLGWRFLLGAGVFRIQLSRVGLGSGLGSGLGRQLGRGRVEPRVQVFDAGGTITSDLRNNSLGVVAFATEVTGLLTDQAEALGHQLSELLGRVARDVDTATATASGERGSNGVRRHPSTGRQESSVRRPGG